VNIEDFNGSWFWAAMGLILLVLELLGGGGFLMGAGIAAILVSLITSFTDFSWASQWTIFTSIAVGSTFVYWYFWNPRNMHTDDPLLNNRMGRLVGYKTKLITPMEQGQGKVQISDALWEVRGDKDLPVGSYVEITAYDGAVLIVKACEV